MKLDLKTLEISILENEVLYKSMKVEFKSLVKRPRKIIGVSHCRNNCFDLKYASKSSLVVIAYSQSPLSVQPDKI